MKKILYIEDEGAFREDVLEILRSEGYETIGAANGEDGLEIITNENPDLILCDINMPGIDGFEVLKSVKQSEQQDTPFLFLTAMGQKKDKITGLNLEADDYIVKPVDFDVLISTIHNKLQKSIKKENPNLETALDSSSQDSPMPKKYENAFLVLQETNDALEDITEQARSLQEQLAAGNIDPSRCKDIARYIHINSENLLMLVSDFLQIHAEVDNLLLPSQPTDLGTLVHTVVTFVHFQHIHKPVNFHTPPKLPLVRLENNYFSKSLQNMLIEIADNMSQTDKIDLAINRDQATNGIHIAIHADLLTDHTMTNVNLLFAQNMIKLHEGTMEYNYEDGNVKIDISLPEERLLPE